ncbi:uncharacterized protein LAESUDRAFT_722904 [Laetiporus sulphureus 93-53]|uniref:RING-type domain-containing protein n=1 Tax=Laetiporus sulphureus 93-53 TaxID=1314785 RepID=A0A165FM13_9APHY|nr:uncharacterized protein LAESUDRAFT_722904 [Laetiporus sulphureus 93-53]KZT09174.1 hypothetical protein LAESUDRAFT_722904 [Laetiporus sulphureus 93-53]
MDVDIAEGEASNPPSQSPDPAPTRNPRRSRVDEDIDEEDMRETNRQRLHSPTPDHQHEPELASQPPEAHEAQQNAPRTPPPPYSRLVYTFDIYPPPPPTPRQEGMQEGAQADPQQDQQPPHFHGPSMYNFTFQIPIVPPTPNAEGVVPPMGMPDFAQGFAPGGEGFFFPFFPFPFGEAREPEPDDPERAEKLIRGLEVVPPGLVQRIERTSTDEGDAMCSVCWEKLSSEGGDLEQQTRTEGIESSGPSEASMEVDSSSPSNDPLYSHLKDLPKVVALPCSHVFHTSCLLPWFTKPHRTTCPTCRFDIDPESLTYVPPRQRRMQQAPQGQEPAQAPAGVQPTQPQPQLAQAGPQPTPGTAPGQEQGAQPRTGAPPFMPLEFSLYFPVAPGVMPGGTPPAPTDEVTAQGQVPTRGQSPPPHRGFFERLFRPRHHQPAETQQQPQPQPAATPDAALPPIPPGGGGAIPGYVRLDDQTARTFLQNLFGPIPQRGPANAPNAAAGGPAPQQRPAPQTGAHTQGRPRPPEKRQWTLPAPPGLTLRQRVERKEREMGLRCWDVSCGLGPSDEDPVPVVDPRTIRQISIRPLGGVGEKVCEHTFHPSCLVSAERVAGWGGEEKKEDKEGMEEVEVSCPVCRAVGVIPRTDWDEGACTLA